MKTEKIYNGSADVVANIEELEVYPAWSTTQVAHIRINDKKNKRWTDCWVSAIVKNGRIRFDINHEKGYPSEEKGTAHKSILAHWLSENTPKYEDLKN